MFSHVAEDESLWGVILEKAFAKLNGNYSHLIAGDPRDASRALNQSPSVIHVHGAAGVTVDRLWRNIMKSDTFNEMMFLNTKVIPGHTQNECNLHSGHAYVVLGAVRLQNGERLVKIRNPWGEESYSCDYSDNSPLWTQKLRREAGATLEAVNEGIFFMRIEDYFE